MICIYEDIFQPFTEHNRIIYSKLKEKFGNDNVFLSIKEGKNKYLSIEKRMYLAEKYFGIKKFLKFDEMKLENINQSITVKDVPVVVFSETRKEELVESYDDLIPNNLYYSKCPSGLMFGKKKFNNDVIPKYLAQTKDPANIYSFFNKIFPNQTSDGLYNIYFDIVSEITSTGGIAPVTKPVLVTRKQFNMVKNPKKIKPKPIKKNKNGFYKHSIPENIDKDKIYIIDITGKVYKMCENKTFEAIENEEIPSDAFFIYV